MPRVQHLAFSHSASDHSLKKFRTPSIGLIVILINTRLLSNAMATRYTRVEGDQTDPEAGLGEPPATDAAIENDQTPLTPISSAYKDTTTPQQRRRSKWSLSRSCSKCMSWIGSCMLLVIMGFVNLCFNIFEEYAFHSSMKVFVTIVLLIERISL